MTYYNNEYDKPFDNYDNEPFSASVLYNNISCFDSFIDVDKKNENVNDFSCFNEFQEISLDDNLSDLYRKQNDCIQKINEIFNSPSQKDDLNNQNFNICTLDNNSINTSHLLSDKMKNISISQLTQVISGISERFYQ